MMSSVPPGEPPQVDLSSKAELKVKGLPAGWRREVVVRKNGQSAGKTDVYYYSPCGKKFRSKPQIARFLGESADLTAFDFSRAGTPGDGSSRRRARDRTARRAIEPTKPPLILVKPLSNNPLRPSGPIRRTCGVIKLPVTWVSPPCDEEAKMSAIKLHDEEPVSTLVPPILDPNRTTGTEGNDESTTDQPKTSKVPPPSSLSVVMVPALWENRLQGVMAYDFETGNEIKVNEEKLQNGPSHSSATATTTAATTATTTTLSNGEVTFSGRGGQSLGAGDKTIELKQTLSQQSIILGAAVCPPIGETKSVLNTLLTKQLHMKEGGKKQHPPPIIATGGGPIVPSLLAHGLGGARGVAKPIAVVPSLKTMRETGSLKQNLSTTQQNRNNILSANSFKQETSVVTTSTSQRQNVRKAGSIPISNGPTLPGGAASAKKGLFVSESELRLQEEKVRLLREQLLAAQSTV